MLLQHLKLLNPPRDPSRCATFVYGLLWKTASSKKEALNLSIKSLMIKIQLDGLHFSWKNSPTALGVCEEKICDGSRNGGAALSREFSPSLEL